MECMKKDRSAILLAYSVGGRDGIGKEERAKGLGMVLWKPLSGQGQGSQKTTTRSHPTVV